MLKCLILLVSLMTRSEIASAYKEKRWALRTKKKKKYGNPSLVSEEGTQARKGQRICCSSSCPISQKVYKTHLALPSFGLLRRLQVGADPLSVSPSAGVHPILHGQSP